MTNRRYLLGQRTLHPGLPHDYEQESTIIEGFIPKALERNENMSSLHGSVHGDLSGFLKTYWALVCFFVVSTP